MRTGKRSSWKFSRRRRNREVRHETFCSADAAGRRAAGRRLPYNDGDERLHHRLLQTTYGRRREPDSLSLQHFDGALHGPCGRPRPDGRGNPSRSARPLRLHLRFRPRSAARRPRQGRQHGRQRTAHRERTLGAKRIRHPAGLREHAHQQLPGSAHAARFHRESRGRAIADQPLDRRAHQREDQESAPGRLARCPNPPGPHQRYLLLWQVAGPVCHLAHAARRLSLCRPAPPPRPTS